METAGVYLLKARMEAMNKCPCGRPAATQAEHPAASVACRCAFCYDFNQYVLTVVHPHRQTIHEREAEQTDIRFVTMRDLQTGAQS